MKTLIKLIIFLFLITLMLLYILIPVIILCDEIIPWYITWLIASHTLVGALIMTVPVIYIFNWIDKNINP